MKLIVQIPCYNEEGTLARTVRDIPRVIAGVDSVEVLIVDDGSRDRTVEVARDCGVDHIVRHPNNKGLARSFRTGLEACLRHGADIIVNTDGDNQYAGADIPKLIQPILDGRADIVVGDRQTDGIAHFSWLKKKLQRFGSAFVRQLSGTQVPDAVSGFRALSREAALRINIVTSFSYTIEMLIQAGNKRMAVASVPIATNGKLRESRLFRNMPVFLARSAETIARMYAMYRPLKVFSALGAILLLAGAAPIVRFLYFYFAGDGSGHVQSLILGGVLILAGSMTLLIGLLADLINFNRRLIETTLEKVSRIELSLSRQDKDGPAHGKPLDTAAVRRALDEAVRPMAAAGGRGGQSDAP
ncbi:MAG: glycosyltransferase family 2 protein [Alphaproteobacteria bacterium]|nr:glycosyltransferase family 2 protein [Alphaproteobacteria bacterium]